MNRTPVLVRFHFVRREIPLTRISYFPERKCWSFFFNFSAALNFVKKTASWELRPACTHFLHISCHSAQEKSLSAVAGQLLSVRTFCNSHNIFLRVSMNICRYFLHPLQNFHKCLVQKMPTEIQWFQFHAFRRTGGSRLHSSASEILFVLSTFVVSFGWNLRKIVEIKLYLFMGCKWNDTPKFNVKPFNEFCLRQRVGTYSRTHQQATSFWPICWQQRWTWKDNLL